MTDETLPFRMRPHLPEDAPRLNPDTELLFDFVWARAEDTARCASRRRDGPGHHFAMGTLLRLSQVRHWLDGSTVGSGAATRYLRRLAALHENHPDFRAHWLL